MKLHLMKWVVLVALFASCHACQGASKTDTDSETDTAGDTGQDVAEDTSQDVAGDTAEDTGQDVAGDTAEDGADVSTDDVTGEDGCAGEACTEAGDTRCADTVIETCTSDASGCLSWEPGTDCEETGDVCIGSAGVATCQCADVCPAVGGLRCASQVIERCETDADGCLDWFVHLDCGAAGGDCNVAGTGCDIPCTAIDAGMSMCLGDLVLLCDGMSYELWEDCEESGDVCIGSAGVATCQCADVCPTEGGLRCTGQVIERCETDADGCLDWFVHLDCGAAGGDCNVAGTGCDIPCTAIEMGMSMCLGDMVLLCDGMSYAPFEDCEESGETCQVFGAGAAACG